MDSDDDEDEEEDTEASESEAENAEEEMSEKKDEEGFGLKSLLEEDANKQSQVRNSLFLILLFIRCHSLNKSLYLTSSICRASDCCMPLVSFKVRCCAKIKTIR